MFIPTSFPCTAWRITSALNVLPVTVESHCTYNSSWGNLFRTDSGNTIYDSELYETKEYAVQAAIEKLADSRTALDRAQSRYDRRKKMVAKLSAEIGGPSV